MEKTEKKENRNNFAFSQIFETEEECVANPFVFQKHPEH